MKRWGPLTAQQQERFLERPETDQLQAYSVRVVQDVIGSQKRLKDILGEAQAQTGFFEPPPERY